MGSDIVCNRLLFNGFLFLRPFNEKLVVSINTLNAFEQDLTDYRD